MAEVSDPRDAEQSLRESEERFRLLVDSVKDYAIFMLDPEGRVASWNQGAQRYTENLEDTIAFLRAGNSNLHLIERRNLGDLRAWCDTAIHLQCASGRDTLSLWNEGVKRVIGVDISDEHIANARRMTESLQAPAT